MPVDQITKKYSYHERNEAFFEDFPITMCDDYPGILSHSLEEEANQDEVCVQCFKLKNQSVDMEMPVSDKLLTINVFDDGPMDPKGTHTAPKTSGNIDTIAYLEAMFDKTLKNTEKVNGSKLLLMLERYAGESVQLKTHEGIDDTVYGSLALYQKEVIEELDTFVLNNSFELLNSEMEGAIAESRDPDKMMQIWEDIQNKMMTNPSVN